MISSGTQPKILTDMFGMMLNVVSKQAESDNLKTEVRGNTDRITELEAKVGGPDQISEKLGLAIRNLPLPAVGSSELDNVREALTEIRAPGVDTLRDVVKACRFGAKEDYLGTVKVEMRNDDSRASIMKNKKNLAHHHNVTMQNLIIKNLKSENQMSMENFARDLLKMIPGGNDVFMAANGHLRQKTSSHQTPNVQHNHQQRFPAPQPPQPRTAQPVGPRSAPHVHPSRHPQPQTTPQQHIRPQQFPRQPLPNQVPLYPQPNMFNQTPYGPMYHINVPATTQYQANPLDLFDPFRSPAMTVPLALANQEQQEQHQTGGDMPQAGPGSVHSDQSNQ